MEEKNETGPSVEPRPEQQCKQARPHDELIAELLDSRRAKTEREHAAAREIERLRDLTDVLAADSKRALELLGSIFYCGNFVSETRNERELELLMRKHGYFIETEVQFDAYCQRAHKAPNAK